MYGLWLTYNTTHRIDASLSCFTTVVLSFKTSHLELCRSNAPTLRYIDVVVAPALDWDLSSMTDHLQIRASNEIPPNNRPQRSTDLKAQSEESARLQLNPLSPEPRHDKVHSPIDIRRLNISQVIIKAISRIANLQHPTHQPSTRANKQKEKKKLTGSLGAQTPNAFALSASLNCPSRPSLLFGSPNTTTALILGSTLAGSRSVARCTMLAPWE